MCGIFCSLSCPNKTDLIQPPELARLLQNRGSDAAQVVCVDDGLVFAGYVLSQQGNTISRQPHETERIMLLFNGDIFGIEPEQLQRHNFSDTAWLAAALSAACCNHNDEFTMLSLFRQLNGPFSLIFYDKLNKKLYFARDSLGRNSLIIQSTQHGGLRLMSTACCLPDFESQESFELPPLGLYQLNLTHSQQVILYPWCSDTPAAWHHAVEGAGALKTLRAAQVTLGLTLSFGPAICPNWLDIRAESTTVRRLPEFDFYGMLDAAQSSAHTATLFPHLLEHPALQAALQTFAELLENSVKERVQKTTKYCAVCAGAGGIACQHAKIAILFSGGVDCTILALLANKYVNAADAIELINVAFESTTGNAHNWLVPDRITAKQSLLELHRLCPERSWNMLEVNVTRQELHSQLEQHIKHLIYPLSTVLDESIGAAFWFASRGRVDATLQTTARVVIVGSGADELFGGYVRHRNAFQRCKGSLSEKLQSVHMELERDWQRIPARNLARDDRVVADNGKTLRAPFIEERFVQFVRNLAASQRCCFLLEEGMGDKLFLRLYGYQLGLRSAATFKKRAIQFGSKIANKKQNGAEQSAYLKTISK